MKRSLHIGFLGEKVVWEILSGSSWLNNLGETHSDFDIFWNDIKIDVKTTMTLMSKKAVKFTNSQFYTQKKKDDVVVLLLALIYEEKYFWILEEKNKGNIYKRFNTAFREDDLKERLLKYSRETKEKNMFSEISS